MDQVPNERPSLLEYAPRREMRGIRYWARRFLARLSRPMPLAMYYLIMFVLSVIAVVLAVIIKLIVAAFSS